MSVPDANKWGGLLLQGNVIKSVNYRFTSGFRNEVKYLYRIRPESDHNLFWLDGDFLDSDSESDRSISEDNGIPDSTLKKIPEVPALPFIGNALDVAGPFDLNRSMCNLGREVCRKHGGIFRLVLMGLKYIVVSDPEIVQQIFSDPIFGKQLTETDALFKELRCFRGEGLTTSKDGKLHDESQAIVAPNLAKTCFSKYLPIIVDCFNRTFREEIGTGAMDVDMKVLLKKCTLRSVGIIAMGIDMFEGTEWKQFVGQLSSVADEAINRVYKGSRYNPLANRAYKNAIKSMEKKLLRVIKDRRLEHELHGKDPANYDMLDIMITSPLHNDKKGNPVTMSDELIRANLNTVLSAGHSTTTSMLSWGLNFLYDSSLGNTDYQFLLLQEISRVTEGKSRYQPTMKDIYKNLPFMTKVLKETIRLCPPLPTILRHVGETTNLGGYQVMKGETIMVSTLGTHLNPKSWNNPEVFDPHRFNEPPPHPCSFIPWAGGARQCIGREFALLSGRIGMLLLLSQYSLELSPNARVREDEHLFVFPQGLLMNLASRTELPQHGCFAGAADDFKYCHRPTVSDDNKWTPVQPSPQPTPAAQVQLTKSQSNAMAWDGLKAVIRESGHQVNILSGTKVAAGNTSKISHLLLQKAMEFNFKTGDSPMPPDSYLPSISSPPSSYTIIAICVSTYQGNPAPNTKKSMEWLRSLITRLENGENELKNFLSNVHYFVFGCGNRNWATTFQKVALFFDENMKKLGATQICSPGIYDESEDDLEDVFSEFYKVMAPKLMHSLPEIGEKRLRAVDASMLSGQTIKPQAPSSAIQMHILGDAQQMGLPPTIASTVRKTFFSCPVQKLVNLSPNADRANLHIELQMQPGMKYRAGDHLVVCPAMPRDIIERVLCLFVDFDEDTVVQWSNQFSAGNHTLQFNFPIGTPMTVGNIFRNLLDLKATPAKQFLVNLSTIVSDPNDAKEIQQIAGSTETYKEWISKNTPISIVDVLERFKPKERDLQRLMEIIPVLKPRPYSICSSPKMDNNSVHICVGVVEDSFPNNKKYLGVSSGYLNNTKTGEHVNVFLEPADEFFDVPKNNDLPIILISAGTGFAPMRSFLRERKGRGASGKNFVFYGCRDENADWLYSDELKSFKDFLTGMHVGFSRSQKFPKQYVQDKMIEQGDLIWDNLQNGAHVYVCGSGSRVGVGARDALLQIITEKSKKNMDFAEDYLAQLEVSGRYEQDVWG